MLEYVLNDNVHAKKTNFCFIKRDHYCRVRRFLENDIANTLNFCKPKLYYVIRDLRRKITLNVWCFIRETVASFSEVNFLTQ